MDRILTSVTIMHRMEPIESIALWCCDGLRCAILHCFVAERGTAALQNGLLRTGHGHTQLRALSSSSCGGGGETEA